MIVKLSDDFGEQWHETKKVEYNRKKTPNGAPAGVFADSVWCNAGVAEVFSDSGGLLAKIDLDKEIDPSERVLD